MDSKVGFIGGSLVAILKSITLHNIVETVVYTVIGTVVSYFVSLLLRWMFGKSRFGS
ncbi:hypothetical protein [Saccharicrinis fermentans]|uniref:Uncharacterized protein n=1 Tax=Saccharicrinis fermentans DSM 9555 = JCM 21142 TaxID=869213 RepID=W7YTQ0_9BACT|nr:hypothetical protein [Saccharicrinis fermentans]GAF05834.1 hypothetical protein JCM21142_114588 [Saccharicrinis fermentans DSM 9555 = JCM 21142]